MGTMITRNEEGERVFITFDNILSEAYGLPQSLTRHPIQDTAKVSDHIIEEPNRLTIVGRVTESPFFEKPLTGKQDDIMSDEFGVPENLGGRPRAIVVWRALKKLRRGIWEYTSVSMGAVPQMVIVSVDFTVEKARHVDFEITMEDVIFAQAQRVELPPLVVVKRNPPSCPSINKGDGTLDDTTNSKDPKVKSAAKQTSDFVGFIDKVAGALGL